MAIGGSPRRTDFAILRYPVPAVSPKLQMTADSRLLWIALAALRSVGGNVAEVLAPFGLDVETAEEPDTRVPLAAVLSAWRAAVAATDNPALGVHLARFADPAAAVSWPMPLSLIEHVGMSAPTIGDAIVTLNRFIRVVRDGMQVSVEYEGQLAIFRVELTPDEPPALVEFLLATCLQIVRRVTRRDFIPIEVWLTHQAPERTTAQSRLAKCPLRFGAPWNGAIVHAEDFMRPLESADPEMHARIVRRAEKLVEGLPNVDLFEHKICAQIEIELQGGNTNAAAVAERIGLSARTLHRRLQQIGLSYQELLDRVRLRLAVRHLAAGKPIGQVAALTGFAQASTFHRAFKSWTGKTPAEYQETELPHLARVLNGIDADSGS